MPAGQTGTPMTYMLNGKQYIVVAIGGSGYSAELRAFRLPGYTATSKSHPDEAKDEGIALTSTAAKC